MPVKMKTVLLVILLLLVMQVVHGAGLKVPTGIKPGELFVVNLQAEPADSLITLRFDAARLEFLGAVQGTPDLQQKSESEIEIRPESGKPAGSYELKFLPRLGSGSFAIKLVDAAGLIKEFPIEFSASEASGSYSWLILVVAAIFALAGYKIWGYQKTAPEMMSTKSLFMNFDELEKARKQNFPDESPANTSSKTAEPSVEPAPSSPAPQSQGKKTVKQAAVKQKPLPASLARLDDHDQANVAPAPPPTNEADKAEPPAEVASEVVAPVELPVAPAAHGKKTLKQPAVKENSLPPALARLSDTPDDKPDSLPGKLSDADKPEIPVVPPVPVPPTENINAAGGGKKTLKSKAVSAPVVSSRLADHVDDAAKPVQAAPVSKPASPAAPEKTARAVPAQTPEPPRAVAAPVEPKERFVFAIEGIGKAYEAQGSIIRIGRQSDNQICISASEVSRKHVEVTVSKGIVSVCPLTDTNVTRINGRTIKEKQTIKPGDTLNLGGTDFVVVKARAI